MVIAFTLPLGFLGMLGVAAAALYLVLFPRTLAQAPRPAVLAGVPLALVTLVSTALAPTPNVGALLSAAGMAVLYTAGLAVMLAVATVGARDGLASAFVLGATVLAGSVLLDALLGWHRIPAGLFDSPDLHNWSAALMVLAWPLSLHLLLAKRKVWAGLSLLLLPSAVVASLSWSGLLGLTIAFPVYLLHPKGPIRGLVRAVGVLLLLAGATVGFVKLEPRLGLLGDVLSGRARIAAEGLELAKLRPVLGWGYSVGRLEPAFAREPLGRYYVDDLALPHFHDLYVQTLFETGVVGFAALALLLAALVAVQTGSWSAATLGAMAGLLTALGLDYSWHVASILLSFFLVAAIGTQATKESSG